MQKRGFAFLFIFILALSALSTSVLAQENSESPINDLQDSEVLDKLEEEFEGEDLELQDPGTLPGDTFYFLDELFSFGDSSEERASEIITLIESGASEEEIRRAFDNYIEDAEELEEADPEKRREIRRRAAAIHNKFKERQGENEFIDGVLEQEGEIITAVEISSKIKELCTQLAELSPEDFYKTCKTDDSSPDWQKDFFEDLTDQQKEEVEQFIDIISECFEDSSNCDCEASTNIQSFVDQCNLISEAETKCRGGDDTACDVADEVGDEIFESLSSAPHLQDALELIERKFSNFEKDRFNHHMPKECREAGISETDPEARKKCSRIMIEIHSPPECKRALLEADVRDEREGRKICDRIMMELHAPECVEQGITDPDECKDFMWDIGSRPDKCQENDIHDFRDCKRFLEGGEDRSGPNRWPDLERCLSISDKNEKLRCFEEAATSGFNQFDNRGPGNFEDRFRKTKERERRCAEKCSEENKAWDFSNGQCSCHFGSGYREGEWHGYDCGALDCQEGSHCEPDYGCVSDQEYYEGYESEDDFEDHDDYDDEYFPEEDSPDEEIEEDHSENNDEEADPSPPSEESSDSSESDNSEGDDSSSDDNSGDSEDSGGEDDSGDSSITGNAFLEYYYN